MQLFEIIASRHDVVWGLTAVQYFFMVQVGAACILLASLGPAFDLSGLRRLSGLALLTGITLVATAPLNLIAELMQQGRFASMFWNTHLSSPLSWGVFVINVVLVFAGVYGLALLKNALVQAHRDGSFSSLLPYALVRGKSPVSPATLKILAWLALVGAAALFVYSGMDLASVSSRIMWSPSIVPLLLAVSGVAGAVALLILLERLSGGLPPERAGIYRRALLASLGLLLAVGLVWLLTEFAFADQAGRTVWNYLSGDAFFSFALLAAALGTLLPFILAALRGSAQMLTSAALLVLLGGYMLRYVITIGGQEMGRTTAGLNQYAPWDIWAHGGLMAAAGTVGLWVFLMILASWTAPWKGFVRQHD